MNETFSLLRVFGRILGGVLLGIGLFGLSVDQAWAMTPKEIMTKNEEARKLKEHEARAVLVMGTKGTSGEKSKEFTMWRKVQKDEIHNNTLTRFHAPAEVKDEGILILENAAGKNEVLLYLPSFKKIRRVESQQQSGSFMGSVFSYSDIATPHVDDYEYKTLKEEKCPSAEAASIVCTVIESIPANEDVKERTGYSKSTVWIRNDNFMAVQAQYYNLEGVYYKLLQANEIKLVDPTNHKWLAHKLDIQNLKNNEFTHLQFSKVKVNPGISDALFTQQNLQKVH